MQFYLAPMEGLTGYVYRSAYHKYFPAADRYFTPFITNKKMSSRERNDILPEHNEGMTVLPQIVKRLVPVISAGFGNPIISNKVGAISASLPPSRNPTPSV